MLSGGEDRLFRRLLRNEPTDAKFLDVGCGFGRNLRVLAKAGFSNIVGVDVRQEAVDGCRAEGYAAHHGVDEWAQLEAEAPFDALVVSHVIEHFAPDDLLVFLERYLGLLREGGRVYFMTPTLGPAFFDDFDHVRPYSPSSLLNVFTSDVRQVQYASAHALECEDLAFRRQPLLLGQTSRLRYLQRRSRRFLALMAVVNALPVAAYFASAGFIGRKTGWLGRFRLTASARAQAPQNHSSAPRDGQRAQAPVPWGESTPTSSMPLASEQRSNSTCPSLPMPPSLHTEGRGAAASMVIGEDSPVERPRSTPVSPSFSEFKPMPVDETARRLSARAGRRSV